VPPSLLPETVKENMSNAKTQAVKRKHQKAQRRMKNKIKAQKANKKGHDKKK
jgi:hypothetical protein